MLFHHAFIQVHIQGIIYRVAQKIRNGIYLPQYVDAITDISVWGNFS